MGENRREIPIETAPSHPEKTQGLLRHVSYTKYESKNQMKTVKWLNRKIKTIMNAIFRSIQPHSLSCAFFVCEINECMESFKAGLKAQHLKRVHWISRLYL